MKKIIIRTMFKKSQKIVGKKFGDLIEKIVIVRKCGYKISLIIHL